MADQLSDDGDEKGGQASEVKDVLRQAPARGFAGSSGA